MATAPACGSRSRVNSRRFVAISAAMQAYAGEISSRLAKAHDETARDRVRAAGEDNGNGRGRILRSLRREAPPAVITVT